MLNDIPDPGYLSAFMLTYTSFTTPDYLLTKLMERFSLQPPPGSDKDFIDLFVRKKQRPVQIRYGIFHVMNRSACFYSGVTAF